jgi:hypothetical protein
VFSHVLAWLGKHSVSLNLMACWFSGVTRDGLMADRQGVPHRLRVQSALQPTVHILLLLLLRLLSAVVPVIVTGLVRGVGAGGACASRLYISSLIFCSSCWSWSGVLVVVPMQPHDMSRMMAGSLS